MDAVEKARYTRTLVEEAADCYERWQQSDLRDLKALECFVERYRLTTEIHPSPMSCKICYLNYGEGLRLLGIHYWDEEKRLLGAAGAASPAEAQRFRREAAAAREKWTEHFRSSCDALEAYFATRESIQPEAYDWASQQYAALGDFGRALSYLNLLDRSVSLNERDRQKVVERRNVYKRRHERQQLEEVRRSLDS